MSFDDMYDPHADPPVKLHTWLDLHVMNYENALRKYWGLDAEACPEYLDFESWQDARRLDEVFDSLFGSIHELSLNPKARRHAESVGTPGDPLRSLSRLVVDEFLADRLQVAMAWSSLDRWQQATSRTRALLMMLGKQRLSDVAQGYLRRAVELFIWGFDLEAIVMASCTLEEALRREFDEVPLEQHGFVLQPGQREWDYWQLIEAAGVLEVFSPEQVSEAHGIRNLRNQLLHDFPDIQQKSGLVLMTLTRLLARLIPARGDAFAS